MLNLSINSKLSILQQLTMSSDMSSILWERELLRSANDPPSVPVTRAGLPRLPAGVLLGRTDSTPDSENTT